jgi:hypothetical protein
MNRSKKYLESFRFHFLALFRWPRMLGLAVTAFLFYLLVFVVFGRTDVSWLISKNPAPHFYWPDLPHFFVSKETTPSGQEETIYSVPSRQLTAQELSQLGATNRAPASK